MDNINLKDGSEAFYEPDGFIGYFEKKYDFKTNSSEKLLVWNCFKVVSRLFGDTATLEHIFTLVTNYHGDGKTLLKQLSELSFDNAVEEDNSSVISGFLGDYYSGLSGPRFATRTYSDCINLRDALRVEREQALHDKFGDRFNIKNCFSFTEFFKSKAEDRVSIKDFYEGRVSLKDYYKSI